MGEDFTENASGCDRGAVTDESKSAASRPVDREIDVFSALGNETRYRILLFVSEANGSVCGCEVEPHFDVQQSSISQSLSRLWKSGLLSREKDGRWRYYETTPLAEKLLTALEDETGTREFTPPTA